MTTKTPIPANREPRPRFGGGIGYVLAQSKVMCDSFGADRAYRLMRLALLSFVVGPLVLAAMALAKLLTHLAG
jgi:hypothetical protein